MSDHTQVLILFTVNLVIIIGGVGRGLSVLGKGLSAILDVRDELHQMQTAIGTKVPPDGLLGDVVSLQHESRRHRDTLIELAFKEGIKPPGGRT